MATLPLRRHTRPVSYTHLDKNDTDVLSDDGLIKNLKFYDNLGYEYTARFSIKSTGTDGEFTVELLNVLDGDGNTYYDPENIQAGQPALNALFGNTEDATKSYTCLLYTSRCV